MSLKDTWTPQDTTMDASPDIPNMLADAIIQNEEDIADLKENGVGSSDVFVIQWDGSTGDKTYEEVAQAIAERKIPVLYEGDVCIATLSGENEAGFVFAQLNLYNISIVKEYVLYRYGGWLSEIMSIVKETTLNETISAANEDFKTAVLNCFPDADTMSFPLEDVSEVSEE